MSKDTQRAVVSSAGTVGPDVLEALKRFVEAVERSQADIIDQAAKSASKISDNFDAQLHLDPAFLHQQITL